MLTLRWKGYARPAEFREGLEFLVEFIRENDVRACLSDLKLMAAILPQDENWATRIWYPKLAETGLEKHAIVTSLDFLNNAAVRRMVNSENSKCNFETRFFVDAKDAFRWVSE